MKILLMENKLNLYDEHVVGITSFDYTHLIKHGVKKSHIETEDVSSISIHELIKKYDIKSLDLLMIDTEGYELNVLKGLSKNSKKVKLIYFEHHYDDMIIKDYKFSDIHKFLKNRGFIMIKKSKMIFRKSFEYVYENQEI